MPAVTRALKTSPTADISRYRVFVLAMFGTCTYCPRCFVINKSTWCYTGAKNKASTEDTLPHACSVAKKKRERNETKREAITSILSSPLYTLCLYKLNHLYTLINSIHSSPLYTYHLYTLITSIHSITCIHSLPLYTHHLYSPITSIHSLPLYTHYPYTLITSIHSSPLYTHHLYIYDHRTLAH